MLHQLFFSLSEKLLLQQIINLQPMTKPCLVFHIFAGYTCCHTNRTKNSRCGTLPHLCSSMAKISHGIQKLTNNHNLFESFDFLLFSLSLYHYLLASIHYNAEHLQKKVRRSSMDNKIWPMATQYFAHKHCPSYPFIQMCRHAITS